ncbi:hypothetical protein AB4K05_14485 [Kluyvera sp. STS39-E]|uniref:hypothetical protein n=1 Tax=Kluyvera sp. STS39-E TaxID=3234748 RepID=UPI0034C5ED1E
MIFVYSKSHIIRNAFLCYSKEKAYGGVYVFSDRLRFLTASTLINEAILILDTVCSPIQDIKWLHNKMLSRVGVDKIYYIIKPQIIGGILGVNEKVISKLNDFSELLNNNKSRKAKSLNEALVEKVTSHRSHQDFLSYELNAQSGREDYIKKHGRKSYLDHRYQLCRKLKFETRLEYETLFLMLNKGTSEKDCFI